MGITVRNACRIGFFLRLFSNGSTQLGKRTSTKPGHRLERQRLARTIRILINHRERGWLPD